MSRRIVAQVGAVLLACTAILAFLVLVPARPLVKAAFAAQQAAILQNSDAADFAPVIAYQARVTDPTTGQPKPNGSYQMVFSLYVNAENGGSPGWTETKTILINGGMLNTLLGDTAPLPTNLFNSTDTLYLGVTFAGNPETTPRQRLAYASHAIFSYEAAHAKNADNAGNAGNASKLNGQDASFYAKAAHQHSGNDITSGTVSQEFIDGNITRDDEVMSIVQANGGNGSGINADYLDGYDSTSLVKTYNSTQVNQTTALAAGGQEYWFTFGYDANQLVVWRVIPAVVGAKMRVDVETEMSNNNTVTYWLRVYNTGSVASGYQLVRYHLYQ
ncbi:MAG: hypothetical protein U0175_38145 [Caldilineaceae bacterium]